MNGLSGHYPPSFNDDYNRPYGNSSHYASELMLPNHLQHTDVHLVWSVMLHCIDQSLSHFLPFLCHSRTLYPKQSPVPLTKL